MLVKAVDEILGTHNSARQLPESTGYSSSMLAAAVADPNLTVT